MRGEMQWPTPDDRNAFSGSITPLQVTGPRQLYRLCGRFTEVDPRSGAKVVRTNNPLGAWWFDSEVFWDLLEQVTEESEDSVLVTCLLRSLVREATAVSFEWNSFTSIHVMDIPAGRAVGAYSGIARQQPRHRPARGAGAGGMLPGGIKQFLIYHVRERHADLVSRSPRPFLIAGPGRA